MDTSLKTGINEKTAMEPVLIVDRDDILGSFLAKKLKDLSFVVFATSGEIQTDSQIVKVPYKKIPKIPDAPYTHLFVVYKDDKELSDTAAHFIKEAKRLHCKVIFVVSYKTKRLPLIEKTTQEYQQASVFFYGDLFGGNNSQLDHLLYKAATYERVEIEGMGLSKLHPVYSEDAAEAILQTVFGSSRGGLYYCVFPKHSMTLLSFLYILQKTNPLIKIDFKKEGEREEIGEIRGTYLFPETYPVETRVKEVIGRGATNLGVLKKILVPRKDATLFTYFSRLIISTILFVLILPILLSVIFTFLGLFELNIAKQQLFEGAIQNSLGATTNSIRFFSFSHLFLEPAKAEAGAIGLADKFSYFDKIQQQSLDLSLGFESAVLSANYFSSVVQGRSKNVSVDLTKAQQELKYFLFSVEKIKASGNLFLSETSFGDIFDKTDILTRISDIIVPLLGPNSKKTYLVLFQNNMELRPGGGFIGSYGLVHLQNAKLYDFTIHDVYDADGQLKGHVEPPYPLRRYFPLVHWYLRDSNFDIDFVNGASVSAFFLNAETGERPDGVISIDVSFVKELIAQLGSIRVPDYNETVTSQNFYLLTQKYSEKNFFPGSTQKKDFLRSVFSSVLQKVADSKGKGVKSILQAVETSVSQKHILLAFSDEPIQNVFTLSGLSSTPLTYTNTEQSSIQDFFGISEANLGANKANYFITREVNQQVSIQDDGQVEETISVSYENKSNAWPGGDYKNYLRIITPQGSSISKISIDGKEQKIIKAIADFQSYEKKDFVPPVGLEVDQYDEDGKTIFGFLTIIPSQNNQTIEISYSLPKQNFASQTFSYNLTYFKQPGTDQYPYKLGIGVGNSYSVFYKSKSLVQNQQTLTFSKEITTDMQFSAKLSRE